MCQYCGNMLQMDHMVPYSLFWAKTGGKNTNFSDIQLIKPQ